MTEETKQIRIEDFLKQFIPRTYAESAAAAYSDMYYKEKLGDFTHEEFLIFWDSVKEMIDFYWKSGEM